MSDGVGGHPPSLPRVGRVPDGGVKAPEWLDLSSKGVLGRTMADVVEALEVAVGPEPTDLRALPRTEGSWRAAVERPRLPARVAWSPTLGYAQVDRAVLKVCERAVAVLPELGAEVSVVDTVFEEDPFPIWRVLTSACNHRTIGHLQGSAQWDKVAPLLQASVEAGGDLSARQLVEALDACHDLNRRLAVVLQGEPLLITPTCAGPPPRSGRQGEVDGTPVADWVQLTYPFNLTRSPAASVFAGLTDEGLPVGIQLIGPQHADLLVVAAAAALEQALGLELVAPGWEDDGV
jgi:aspartyl-tRNA(Asn)/glutamyl-tRNA(Gln) amidotransferase subunit A